MSKTPEDIQCPACGYYCSGNGGFGCIDKPELVRIVKQAASDSVLNPPTTPPAPDLERLQQAARQLQEAEITIGEYLQLTRELIAAELARVEVESKIAVHEWYIMKANKVAEVFKEPVDKHKVTLHSIIYTAELEIKKLQATRPPRRLTDG